MVIIRTISGFAAAAAIFAMSCAPGARFQYIHLEAEEGAVGLPTLVEEDNTASGGKFIWRPRTATVQTISVPESGAYRVWGRVIAPDGNNDSWNVELDGKRRFCWNNMRHADHWVWTRLTAGRTAEKMKVFNWEIDAGTHTIALEARDLNSQKIDQWLFTTDTSFVPPDSFAGTHGQVVKRKAGDLLIFEAESHDVTPPFAFGQDAKASGSAFIWVPDTGMVQRFTVARGDTYTVWLRIKAPKGNSDSYVVSIDGKKPFSYNNMPKSRDWWRWDDLHDSRNKNRRLRLYLEKGEHTLLFRTREAGARIDKICITNNPVWDPRPPRRKR